MYWRFVNINSDQNTCFSLLQQMKGKRYVLFPCFLNIQPTFLRHLFVRYWFRVQLSFYRFFRWLPWTSTQVCKNRSSNPRLFLSDSSVYQYNLPRWNLYNGMTSAREERQWLSYRQRLCLRTELGHLCVKGLQDIFAWVCAIKFFFQEVKLCN